MKSSRLFAVPLVMLIAALIACASTPLGVATKAPTEQLPAFTIQGTYATIAPLAEACAAIANNAANPAVTRDGCRTLLAASKEPIMKLHDAYLTFQKVKDEVAAGTTTQEQLALAQQHLASQEATATPLVGQFVSAMGGGK